MSAPSEYGQAKAEILRRCTTAGLNEWEMETLLAALEAGGLRDLADTAAEAGDVQTADLLRGMAKGMRPRGWRKLLPAGAGGTR